MKHHLSLILLFAAIVGTLFSCSNELEIFSDTRPNDYVFSVFNVDQDTNYIILQKSVKKGKNDDIFLEDLFYEDDEVEVALLRYPSGSSNPIEIVATPIWIDNKNEGVFPFPEAKVYRVVASQWDVNSRYGVRATLLSSGKVIETDRPIAVHDKAQVSGVVATNTTPKSLSFFNNQGILGTLNLGLISKSNGGTAQMNLLIGVEETQNGETDTVEVSIPIFSGIPSTSSINTVLRPERLMSALEDALEENSGIQRRFLGVQFGNGSSTGSNSVFGFCAGIEIGETEATLSNYNSIVFNTQGISTSNPDFSNIENGLGIFTVMRTQSFPLSRRKFYFTQRDLDLLACSDELAAYQFPTYSPSPGSLGEDYSSTKCN